ncbi:4'-phosphopantetheinyl transferase family protein [Romboutsia lituseburensis]|uniref:4'-phosphopantetheinyl transferase family protein n=1 Tax=Romboutsia lituseburensis TaxID=1537 RepID=UPI00215A81A3|nr:4'-phosphopantetheinyl transferase superfamily protein [Romboutsia lituseburensis]MCR8746645.1 4'-phosphopantetheinyl transferase superfamily protein [Romboutsia lituseburensis]
MQNKVIIFKLKNFKKIDYKNYLELINEKYCLILMVDINEFEEVEKLEKYLTIDEEIKKEKYYYKRKKKCYVISHGIVNYIYSKWIGCTVKELSFNKGPFLKPYIDNEYRIQYNITHSKDLLAIGLSKYTIGIDLEYIDKNMDYEDIVNMCFHKKESSFIQKNLNLFYKVWVIKEAYLKLIGEGLNRPLNSFYIEQYLHKEQNEFTLVDEYKKSKEKAYIFYPLENYVGAFCLK